MKITLSTLLLLACWCHAAVPTLESFETTQFDTNALSIKYRSDWTNEVGVLRPATVNTEVTLTNLNLYETFVTPAKVYALTLGTNELNVATNTSWLLSSPTNDAAQVILSLSAGKFQGQWLLITSQNDTGGFTLPDQSEQYDVPGALVDMQGDWVGTTNRGTILQYVAPDWIEMFRFNPEAPAPSGFTTGAGVTNISDVVSGNYTAGANITLTTNANGAVEIVAAGGGGGDTIWTNVSGTITPLDGQTTNRLSFTSGAATSTTNSALLIGTSSLWAGGLLGDFKNNGVSAVRLGSNGDSAFGRYSSLWINPAATSTNSVQLFVVAGLEHDETVAIVGAAASDDSGNNYWLGQFESYTNTARLKLEDVNGIKFLADPWVATSGGAVAYEMDTANVLTNGDSLFIVANNNVVHARIAGNSGYSGTGAKFLTDDGTYQTGSSASTITYTNQFIYNGRVTYNADVYVTNSSTVYINGVDVRTDWQGGAASDETTALTVSTNVLRMQLPFAATLVGVYASVTTPQASGSILTLDLKESGTTVFSTLPTIDNGEYGTDTATPAVISDTAIAQFAPLVWSITQVGTPPAGLKVWIKVIKLL